MVTLLITAVVVLAVLGIGIYFWQKPAPDNFVNLLPPPPPNARGLFAEEFSTDTDDEEQLALIARRHDDLFKEARTGKRSALNEAHQSGDATLYDRVLSALVEYSDSEPKLLSLISYIGQNELPVNKHLAAAVIASWQPRPARNP